MLDQNIYTLIAQELRSVLGAENVLDHPVDLSVYDSDGLTLDQAKPDLVALPASTEEVSAVVRIANRFDVPVVPRGAGTGLSGGSTTIHGGISLSLTRMAKLLKLDPGQMLAVVEAGATNASISESAAQYNLSFAPDPSSQLASTVGGNVAENAGGPHTLKYGMTGEHVLSLKVVLADGSVTTFGANSLCRVGPDFLGLLVGSEGTLVVVTEVTVRLTPLPSHVETLLAYFPELEDGGRAVSEIVAQGIIPAAMEMVDQTTLKAVESDLKLGLKTEHAALLIVELDGPSLGITSERNLVEEIVLKNNAADLRWARDRSERKQIWQARKSAFSALGRIAPHGYVMDGVIPRSRLAETIGRIRAIGDRHNVRIANVYHAGDGNLHPCLLYHKENENEVKRVMMAGREILELCIEMGGTLSGEHGVGIEKLRDMPLAFSPQALELMQRIRLVFNPNEILNPGKAVPSLKHCGESGQRPLLRYKLSSAC